MRTIQSSPFHLYCLAGPDAGTLVPLEPGSIVLGRGSLMTTSKVELADKQTSAIHACFTVAAGGDFVTVTDLHSLNGVLKGRFRKLAPGLPLSFVRFKPVLDGALLVPDEMLRVGDNYWQLRKPDESFKFTQADYASPHSQTGLLAGRRVWVLLFPFVSLIMLLVRWLPMFLVTYAGVLLGGVSLFLLLRWWLTRSAVTWFSPCYIPHLPIFVGAKQVPTEVSFVLPEAVRVRWLPLQVAWFSQRKRSSFCLPAGLIEVGGSDSFAHRLSLGLLTLLKLKQAGISASLTVDDAATVTVKAGEKAWIFASATPSDAISLRLFLPVSAILKGAALSQIHQHFSQNDLPHTVLDLDTLEELVATVNDRVAVNESFSRGLRVPVGVDSEGQPFWIDLVSQGPHALITGTTGSGKSVALRTWLHQLCRYYSPHQLRLVLFDYKGGATLQGFDQYPHTEGIVTDLDLGLTQRVLWGLAAELKSRELALLQAGFPDLCTWEELKPESALPRIICVVDEFRVMQHSHPQDLENLLDLAGRGRSLGIHLVLATQSAGGIVSAQLRANVSLRIAFRTATLADSLDILGSAQAFEIGEPGISFISGAGQSEIFRGRWALSQTGAQKDVIARQNLTLWKPSLWQAYETGQLSAPGPACANLVAWADLPQQREYAPLVWQSGVLAVVAEGWVRERLLQQCGAEGAFALDTAEVSLWWVLLNNARLLGIQVVIRDLYVFMQKLDVEFGIGSGREIWDEVLRCGQRILVGVGVSEINLCKGISKVLLRVGGSTSKTLGIGREMLQGIQLLRPLPDGSDALVDAVIWRWDEVERLVGAVALAVDSKPALAEHFSTQRLVAVGAEQLKTLCRQNATEKEIYIYTNNLLEELEIVSLGCADAVIRVESPQLGNAEIVSGKQNVGCVTGYLRLLPAQVQLLKLPKYVKTLVTETNDLWFQVGGKWLRYIT